MFIAGSPASFKIVPSMAAPRCMTRSMLAVRSFPTSMGAGRSNARRGSATMGTKPGFSATTRYDPGARFET